MLQLSWLFERFSGLRKRSAWGLPRHREDLFMFVEGLGFAA